MLLNDIAALAAAAHHRRLKIAGFLHLVGQQAGVIGLIQRETGIIRHTAVDRDIVLVAGDLFHRAAGIQRHASRAHDAAARLHMDLRHVDAQAGAGLLDGGGHLADLGVHVQIGVALHIAHAVAAAQIQLLGHIAVLFLHGGDELQHDHSGTLEHVLIEHLRADVTVEAHQFHMGLGQRIDGDLLGLTGLNGGAELAVHLTGGDGLVGMGIDAGGQAQQHLLADAAAGGLGLDGLDLLHVVGHEIAHMVVHAVDDIGVGLVVAVEIGVGQVIARLQCTVDLAGGHHVDAHALLLHDLINALEGVGLAGVQRTAGRTEMLLEGVLIYAALMADIVLIHQIQRRAVLLGQLDGILSREKQVAVGADGDILTDHSFFLSLASAQQADCSYVW